MDRLLALLVLLVPLLASAPAQAGRLDGPDCALVFEVYAHAVAVGKTQRFLAVTDDYTECVLGEALRGPGRPAELLDALEARRQLDRQVRRSAYSGAAQAHPLVVKAGFLAVRELGSQARAVYISSLVRTPSQQRRLLRSERLGRWAAQRSKHLLGGLAVDIAFVGRKRSMAALGQQVRRALERELGSQASLLRVVVERYCLHIELTQRNPVARRIIEERKRELYRKGILARIEPGVIPRVSDYRTEAEWRRRR
ncbi:MAG: hypothetical protein AAFZ18_07545 [Myxococcota bacterium]